MGKEDQERVIAVYNSKLVLKNQLLECSQTYKDVSSWTYRGMYLFLSVILGKEEEERVIAVCNSKLILKDQLLKKMQPGRVNRLGNIQVGYVI